MTGRKWAVRGLVFGVAGALVVLALAYQHWTSPEVVRRLVVAKLAAKFPGATVTVESAHLRVLGGIAVREVRLARRDDAGNTSFLYIPAAILYHDKEQLLDGRLVLRKIEMERPRLRVWRERDGRWSLQGVIAPPTPDERLPTLVFRQTAVVVEDRTAPPGSLPLEIRDADFTLVNDPEDTVVFDGGGASDLGPLRLAGRWDRRRGTVAATVNAAAVPVGPPLLARLASLCPQAADHLSQLSASAKVEATLALDPAAPKPWSYAATLTLTGGRFAHRDLPLALEDLEVTLRCGDGIVSHGDLKARSGAATVTLVARDIALPTACLPDETCPSPVTLLRDADLTVRNIAAGEALFDGPLLKKFKRDIYDRYLPSGSADVTFQVRPAGSGPWQKRLVIEPRGMTATYEKFIYPLVSVTGKVELLAGGPVGDSWDIDLTGRASGRPIRVTGAIRGARPTHTVALDVTGEGVPLDDKVLYALDHLPKGDDTRTNYGDVLRSFAATGLVDFRVRVARDVAHDRYLNHYALRLRGGSVRYREFPLRFDDVSGILEIRSDQSWEFRDFTGRHGDGTIATHGGSKGKGDGIRVEVVGRGLRLDADLRAALKTDKIDLHRVWDTFAPEADGRFDCDGVVVVPPPTPGQETRPVVDLTARPRGVAVLPTFFPLRLADLVGTFRYVQNAVTLENVVARHGKTTFRIDKGVVLLKAGGGYTADLTNVHAEPLRPDDDFAKALRKIHETLWAGWTRLDVQGPCDLHARLYIDAPPRDEKPRLFWDGAFALRGASLKTGVRLENVHGIVAARGWFNGTRLDGVDGNIDLRSLTVLGQPLTDFRGEFQVTEDEPDVLRLPGLMASYLGGHIYGPGRVVFGPQLRYDLDLTASQVRLDEFARHNFRGRPKSPEMGGLASGRLTLHGDGNELSGLRGHGKLDIPSGKLANFNPVVDLLKFLGLRLPDRTMFEEAHATFDIEGERAKVGKLELFGNVISLRGAGDLNIDGSDLNLDFHVDWARLGQVLPPGIREVPREISNQLFKVELRGRFDEPRFRRQPVPLLTDPIRRLFAEDGKETRGRNE